MKFISHKAFGRAMVLALLWAASLMVSNVVSDRIHYRDEARESIARSHAGRQYLSGPALAIPIDEIYSEQETYTVDRQERTRRVERRDSRHLVVLPERLSIDANLAVAPRWRGLFKVNAYRVGATVQGHWRVPDFSTVRRRHEGSRIEVGPQARLLLPIAQTRGLQELVVTVDSQPARAAAHTLAIGGQSTVDVPLATPAGGRELPFAIRLSMDGSDALDFAPLGEVNQLRLQADWPHPSFEGLMLPVSRTVHAQGFSAEWKVASLATALPQRWRERVEACLSDHCATGLSSGSQGESANRPGRAASTAPGAGSFPFASDTLAGVRLFDPVDLYTLTDRATKYAMLFVLLTFGSVVLFEVFRRLDVHPVQHALVGLSVVVFFLLLLSLAERIGFDRAYAAAATACLSLVSYYLRHVLGGRLRALGFAAGLALGFGCLYLLLNSEQNTLLIGTLLLFSLLAAFMVATRRTRWDELLFSGHPEPKAKPAAPPNAGAPESSSAPA